MSHGDFQNAAFLAMVVVRELGGVDFDGLIERQKSDFVLLCGLFDVLVPEIGVGSAAHAVEIRLPRAAGQLESTFDSIWEAC